MGAARNMTEENRSEYLISQPGPRASDGIYQAAQAARLGAPIAEYSYDKGIHANARAGNMGLVMGCLITPALFVILLRS